MMIELLMQAWLIQASFVVLVSNTIYLGSGGSVPSVRILTFAPHAIILESIVWTINSYALIVRMMISTIGKSSRCYLFQ